MVPADYLTSDWPKPDIRRKTGSTEEAEEFIRLNVGFGRKAATYNEGNALCTMAGSVEPFDRQRLGCNVVAQSETRTGKYLEPRVERRNWIIKV